MVIKIEKSHPYFKNITMSKMPVYVTGLSKDSELIKKMWNDHYPLVYDWMVEGKKNRAGVRQALGKAWKTIFIIPSQEALGSNEVSVEGEMAVSSTSGIMVWLGADVVYNMYDDHWLNETQVQIYRSWNDLVDDFNYWNYDMNDIEWD
jgi:hypothetical protein